MNWKKHRFPLILMAVIAAYSCASIGAPDGGPYDEEPPRFVGSTPELHATGNQKSRIELEFDEFIKLEKAAEKVVISPPQMEQPEIKVSGKKVVIELIDSLKDSTTYTVDFSDAIVDNNEGNPMGHFTYSFSTGTSIDTMEVSGTVLNAADLEPIKGIQVGLHKNLNDSALTTLPFDRVSRTDSRGHFIIRGVAPGKYRIYALMDGNQNYLYDSKTEMIAFSDSVIATSMMPATRQDTIDYQIPRVEDMIITEMALELAFEGQRLHDLMRVAMRRGDNAYLADPISRRDGEVDAALRAKLMNEQNWYLPLP